jgi:short-chain fatty acids transporter
MCSAPSARALAALDLNKSGNPMFLTAGAAAGARNFVRAVTEAIPATGGVLIQLRSRATFGMIVGTGLSAKLAHLFTPASTHDTLRRSPPPLSRAGPVHSLGGSKKWAVEAPYVPQAATHQVHLGWVVQIYNAAGAAESGQPVLMLPLLGHPARKARDLIGYSTLYLKAAAGGVLPCWFGAHHRLCPR